MQRLRDAWLQYRGALLAYEQRYSVDDPALLRFKKEVLSSQSLGFSAAAQAAAPAFPFETVGIPKLVEEHAQEKTGSANVPDENERNGPLDAGLLGPGYSFMLYPKEVQHHRASQQTATSRNDAPDSAGEVPSTETEQKEEEEEAAAAADDPFDITFSPENVSKLSKILTPLTYAGSHVGKRRGGQPDEEQRAKEIGETSLEP